VAGIFVMNVGVVPWTDDKGGFLWAMAIIVVVSIVVYWLLKRSGTVGR
jgi:Mg2+ and Co2+ transporter CorA